MANDSLKAALHHAGLTPEQFADIVGVDPKTVQRWVAGRTPFARHRAAIARALDSSEHALWPDSTPPAPGALSPDPAPAAGEVIGSWAYDTDHDAPDPAAFISQTTGPVAIYDDGWYSVLEAPGLTDAVLQAAGAGREIRLLSHRPTRALRPLIAQDAITIKVTWDETRLAVIHAQDTMLLTLRLEAEADQPPPLLHLRRHTTNGLFDRLARHLGMLWDHAEETVVNVEDFYARVIEQSLDDDDDDDQEDEDEDPEPDQPVDQIPRAPEQPPDHPQRAHLPTPPQAPSATVRRWPRRPT